MRRRAACLALLLGIAVFQGCVAPVARNGVQETLEQSSVSDRRESALALAAHQPLVSAIRFFIGTPYQYGGTNRRGMDCSGFVVAVFLRTYRMMLPHSSEELYAMACPVPADSAQTGDLVFFGARHGRRIDHVGICIDRRQFAHASTQNGVMVSSLNEEYFRKRFAGIRRLF
jgi:cell wall-associated NlpC family hydrolase